MGNVVVYRAGSGTGDLLSTGNPVFLDEFSPTGTLVQSVALPTTASGNNNPLIASGTATSEGLLNRSVNGRFLLPTGYGTTIPAASSLPGTAGTAVPRIIGTVDGNATIDTSTALSDFASGNNPRSAASLDGTGLYGTGGAGGVRFAANTSAPTPTTSTQVSSTVANLRNVNIFGGQLFVSTSSGSTVRIGTVGSGTPTTAGQTITNLPGFPVTGSPYQFILLDLIPNVGFTPAGGTNTGLDTLYVADDSPGTIQKYRFDGTNFVVGGTATFAGARGLTGYATAGNVTLFVTTGASTAAGGGTLATLTDAAAATSTLSGAPTNIATAAPNTAFRGVALAPIAPTAASWRGGKALAAGKGVVVSWKAGREADNLGFDVLRARKASALRVKVTRKLITGSALSGAGGNTGAYRFRDRRGKPGDKYFVVSRATDGTKKVHGPLVARSSTRKASR